MTLYHLPKPLINEICIDVKFNPSPNKTMMDSLNIKISTKNTKNSPDRGSHLKFGMVSKFSGTGPLNKLFSMFLFKMQVKIIR